MDYYQIYSNLPLTLSRSCRTSSEDIRSSSVYSGREKKSVMFPGGEVTLYQEKFHS